MSRWSYHVPILAYHKVGVFKGDHVPTVAAGAFERQLEWLQRLGRQVVPLDAAVEALRPGGAKPRKALVITFDDGYEETCTIAWPILKRFGFPATVFVTPTEVGLPGFATWQQLAAAAREGLTIGSHTMHHSYLPLVKPADLAKELVESKRIIEERIGQPVHYLSYPIGGFTPEAQAAARAAGYRAACTTNRAVSHETRDLFAIRRIKVTDRDAHPLPLMAKTSGYYDAFRQLKQPN